MGDTTHGLVPIPVLGHIGTNKHMNTPYTAKYAPLALVMALVGAPSAQAITLADIPAGTGYAAQDLCTRTMQSMDDFERVKKAYVMPKVTPLPLVWWISNQVGDQVSVQTVVPFLSNKRTAIYRRNLGCTMVPPGTSEAVVRSQAFKPAAVPLSSKQAWPEGDGAVESSQLSADQASLLASQSAELFKETSSKPEEKQNTFALLVAHDGHLVYEQYAPGYQRSQAQLGWSMTKSLTALIAGIMATDGRISLDAPVGLPLWANSPKAAITWKQLLDMAPGLAWTEEYTGASDTTEMLFSQGDQGGWAANKPLTSAPGTVFNYSTGFPTIAMLRMKQLLGNNHQALYDYYQKRLFAPLGIRQGVIEPDASGTPAGGARGVLRPVDWLRLGQLVAQKGQWQNKPVIDQAVFDRLLAPSNANPGYGGYVWRINDTTRTNIPDALRQRLPADLLTFRGVMGQIMVIVPSHNLVVLRMGVSFDMPKTLTNVLSATADMLDQF